MQISVVNSSIQNASLPFPSLCCAWVWRELGLESGVFGMCVKLIGGCRPVVLWWGLMWCTRVCECECACMHAECGCRALRCAIVDLWRGMWGGGVWYGVWGLDGVEL